LFPYSYPPRNDRFLLKRYVHTGRKVSFYNVDLIRTFKKLYLILEITALDIFRISHLLIVLLLHFARG
jgi:hypothetical protein